MIIYLIFLLFIGIKAKLPDGFVYIQDIDPTIRVNLKYFNGDNFIGWRIPCYNANKGILTQQAAIALSKAQKEFNKQNYCILVYDAYRPQCAVDFFVQWIKSMPDEQRNKPFFYPRVDKRTFIEQGYVASKSGHSRGSTLDMTVIECDKHFLERGVPEMRNFDGIILPFNIDNTLDVGTGFDLMDEASHGENNIVKKPHKERRDYINAVMSEVGFKVLEEEWWHFTLIDEPYKHEYFNFTVE